ncbi:sigma-70 family RNA polymerase sigma factor [Bacillus sp. UNC438CL73TsuS30]|uniref:sigma-70 family RNA polymerase sigma factor n=1 Tax=Bacillus sp. UNC438CL73TsuS30 TaxID=1340434 RepID=UPI00047D3FBF|nr:sigma-70 family RNA polymerase sigma factor [Bacillus sp. UNC438CL73TsuS30]
MESFEELVVQYSPMIHKIIHTLHIYKNWDEFYQHGLIALWEASNRFDPEKGNFTTYAYNYIRGFLLLELTKAHKYEENCVCPKEEFWETAEGIVIDYPLETETILSVCTTLTPNQRKWVLYTALYDLSIKEIAIKEKVSMSAVKSWRAGAREKLRERIAE